MAKLGSWGQAVRCKSQNSVGRSSKSSGRGFIGDHRTEVGEKKRFIIPTFIDENGNEGLFLQSRSVHPVKKRGAVAIKTAKGNEFKPYAVGTSHPYKQPSFEASLQVAERGDVCVFSELSALTETDRWAKVNELGNDKDTDAGKAEFKDFNRDFNARNQYIEASSYKNREGEWQDHLENYLLILELVSETVEEARTSGVKRKVAQVEVDDKGFPKYEPKFWKVSAKRLGEIQSAVDLALDNNLLSDDALHAYTENAGTDDEVVNYAGWVELEISYPEKEGSSAKMESSREATISAVNGNVSTVSDEFIQDFRDNKASELFTKATNDFEYGKSHLKAYTRAEQLEMLSDDARDYFTYLLETYPTEAKEFEDRFKGYFDNILEQAGEKQPAKDEGTEEDVKEETPASETPASETPAEEVEESKKARATKSKTNANKLNELLSGI